MTRSRAELLQTVTYGLICLILIIFSLKSAAFIFIPIAWSVFLSVALTPMCIWLENKGFSRGIAVITSIVVITVVVTIVMYILINQAMGLIEVTPVLEKKINAYMENIQAFLSETFGRFGGNNPISKDLSTFFSKEHISSFLESTLETLFLIGIIPVYVFFLIYYRDFFYEFLKRVTANKENIQLVWINEAILMVQNYLKGLFMVTIIVAIMAGIFFFFLGLKYFLFFALFIALFNLIPYIGVVLSSVISILYVLLSTDSLWYPLFTLAFLWGIQIIENNLITPIVVGSKIQLNPLAVILAIMVGSQVWGLSGIILFIPLLGVLKIIFDRIDFLQPYGYLLGTDIPIVEKKGFFQRRVKKRGKQHRKDH